MFLCTLWFEQLHVRDDQCKCLNNTCVFLDDGDDGSNNNDTYDVGIMLAKVVNI
jgi:hypothetical protein